MDCEREGDIPGIARETPAGLLQRAGGFVEADRWETEEEADAASGIMTPEQIMEKLEARVGLKGRKLFEQFLRKVNKLQAQQYLEAQAERSRERGPV